MINTIDSNSVAQDASTASTPELSIVMPCLNEAETLEQCIREAQRAAAASGILAEVIIADNGSTDGSQEIAQRCGARVILVKIRGYGSALRTGIAACQGEFVIMGDSDASYDFGALSGFLEKLREGHDLVMGNRFRGRIDPGAMPWKHRYIGNPVLSGLGRLFFRCPVGDFHCGLRGFRKDAIGRLGLSTDGMEFASEMVVKSTMHGLRIAEIPIVLRKDGRSRRPHLRSWRDGWRHLQFLLLYCPTWLFLIPAATMFFGGLIAMVLLAVLGPISLGRITFSINTALVSALLVLLGSQIFLLGVFSRQLGALLGALPPNGLFSREQPYISLESGLCLGIAIAALGLGGLIFATIDWISSGMGDLEQAVTLSYVLPSVTLIMLGIELIFASFFLKVLSFARLRSESTASWPERP